MNTEARVDSYTKPRDAELARAFLESHDITVRLEGEALNNAAFVVGPILGGTRLYVDEKDGERANALLSDYHDQLSKEHLSRKEHPDHLVTRACIAAFIGFVTVPIVVHAYSVWLLTHIDRTKVSPEKRYRYPLAWAGNSLAFGLLSIWILLRVLLR
jgi:hypothetical protein